MRRYTLTMAERSRVLRSTSPKGGGMQAALYMLAVHLHGEKLYVPDELFGRFRRYLETMGTEGGWQARLPAQMLADLTGTEPAEREGDLF